MKISNKPKPAEVQGAKEAWWYENRGSIDVIVHVEGRGVIMVNIKRKQLADYIARSERGKT